MKKYKVRAKHVYYHDYIVRAENTEEAKRIVKELCAAREDNGPTELEEPLEEPDPVEEVRIEGR